jgi:hypothetical protein
MPGEAVTADRMTALDMARNLAASVERYARQSEADQLGAMLNQTGERAHAAAQLAANLALVSIAEDFHRVADVACKFDAWADTNDGAIADARATREHMKRWTEGAESHQGESP